MKAEILSIGSELVSGQNLDTNSRWLSQKLSELGIPIVFHTTVGDDLDDNVHAVKAALDRAELVLVTGGLGPTQDDLTREVLAKVADVKLVEDAVSLVHIRTLFQNRNREMPERNRVQALLPEGAEALANPTGTAPGVWLTLGVKHIAAMPGVPSEMTRMFDEQVKPRLLARGLGTGVTLERRIHCFGAGESAIEEKVVDFTKRGHVPEVGITVSDATVTLRIRATAATHAEAEEQIAPVATAIRERLGDFVFGCDDEELHNVAVRLLKENNLTVATAESITAGLLAHRLSSVPGVSVHLHGGVVVYCDDAKCQQLDVPSALIEKYTAVSEPVAIAMAEGVRKKFGTDIGLATTGYAGPDGGTDGTPVGTVYVAVATAKETRVQKFIWGGTRGEIQSRTAKLALNLLRLRLESVKIES